VLDYFSKHGLYKNEYEPFSINELREAFQTNMYIINVFIRLEGE